MEQVVVERIFPKICNKQKEDDFSDDQVFRMLWKYAMHLVLRTCCAAARAFAASFASRASSSLQLWRSVERARRAISGRLLSLLACTLCWWERARDRRTSQAGGWTWQKRDGWKLAAGRQVYGIRLGSMDKNKVQWNYFTLRIFLCSMTEVARTNGLLNFGSVSTSRYAFQLVSVHNTQHLLPHILRSP